MYRFTEGRSLRRGSTPRVPANNNKTMKKIFRFFRELQKWFLLTFCDTKIKTVQFPAFKVTFRKFTTEIKSVSGNFALKTIGMVYPNAFLYDALIKGDEGLVQWYCNRMYEITALLLTDQGLADDVQKALTKYDKRLQVVAERKAKEVTEEEDAIAAEQVKANIEYANMTKKQRKHYKKALRDELRNMSNENGKQ